MRELKLFDYESNQVRVIKDEAQEPWFLGRDVCEILGFASPWMAYDRLDKDEKCNLSRTEVGMEPGKAVVLVSEPGLYKLILRSDKPKAKDFQRWVAHEVLPSIRKTGGLCG